MANDAGLDGRPADEYFGASADTGAGVVDADGNDSLMDWPMAENAAFDEYESASYEADDGIGLEMYGAEPNGLPAVVANVLSTANGATVDGGPYVLCAGSDDGSEYEDLPFVLTLLRCTTSANAPHATSNSPRTGASICETKRTMVFTYRSAAFAVIRINMLLVPRNCRSGNWCFKTSRRSFSIIDFRRRAFVFAQFTGRFAARVEYTSPYGHLFAYRRSFSRHI